MCQGFRWQMGGRWLGSRWQTERHGPVKPGDDEIFGGGGRFPATSWTDLSALAVGVDPERQMEALQRICQRYWKPIHAYIRRRGHDHEAARDLTQDFFHHLLRKERLKLADQARGRFRTFILTALGHFLASEWARRTAKKRDERIVVPLEMPGADAAGDAMGGFARFEPKDAGDTPDRAFDRLWAAEVLRSTRARLLSELTAEARPEPLRLLALALDEAGDDSYATLSAELGKSEAALRKAVERLRSRWRSLLMAEVAATVPSPADIEPELRELLEIIRS